VLGGLYQLIAPHLAKKQRRLLVGTAARAFSRDGGARMAAASAAPAMDPSGPLPGSLAAHWVATSTPSVGSASRACQLLSSEADRVDACGDRK
jgi:hypothetical protein